VERGQALVHSRRLLLLVPRREKKRSVSLIGEYQGKWISISIWQGTRLLCMPQAARLLHARDR